MSMSSATNLLLVSHARFRDSIVHMSTLSTPRHRTIVAYARPTNEDAEHPLPGVFNFGNSFRNVRHGESNNTSLACQLGCAQGQVIVFGTLASAFAPDRTECIVVQPPAIAQWLLPGRHIAEGVILGLYCYAVNRVSPDKFPGIFFSRSNAGLPQAPGSNDLLLGSPLGGL